MVFDFVPTFVRNHRLFYQGLESKLHRREKSNKFQSARGVQGVSDTGHGVHGESRTNHAVHGEGSAGRGVVGISQTFVGVTGQSTVGMAS